MNRVFALLLFLVLSLPADASAETTLVIDRLERTGLSQAVPEVGLSTLLEGTITNLDLEVFVLVYQPRLKGWTLFPATIDTIPESGGRYRWRAICRFGELDGTGVGESYQVRAMALDKATISGGVSEKALADAVKTNTLVVKRIK